MAQFKVKSSITLHFVSFGFGFPHMGRQMAEETMTALVDELVKFCEEKGGMVSRSTVEVFAPEIVQDEEGHDA